MERNPIRFRREIVDGEIKTPRSVASGPSPAIRLETWEIPPIPYLHLSPHDITTSLQPPNLHMYIKYIYLSFPSHTTLSVSGNNLILLVPFLRPALYIALTPALMSLMIRTPRP